MSVPPGSTIGIVGGGHTPNANAHVNDLTRSIQPQRGKVDFPKLTDLDTSGVTRRGDLELEI